MDATIRAFNQRLSIAGIFIYDEKKWNSKKWFTFQILNFILVILANIFSFSYTVDCLPDFASSINAGYIALTFNFLLVSVCTFLFNKTSFQNFVDKMVFNDPALEHPFTRYILQSPAIKGGRSKEFKMFLINSQERLSRICRLLIQIYVYMVTISVSLYMCGPIYKMSVREDKSTRILPFDMLFPLSVDNMAVYVVTFFFQAQAGYLCCIGYPGLMATLTLLILQISRQLQSLSFIMLNLDELVLEVTGERDERWRAACSWILSRSIDHYLNIKRFVKELSDACEYCFVMSIILAISVEGICFVKIAITKKVFNLDMMKYCVHLIAFVVGIFGISFLGQVLEDARSDFERAVTHKWFIFDPKHRKSILIFYFAVSQSISLKIYGSITLNFETFTWFIKTGMSFFTLMMSVLEN